MNTLQSSLISLRIILALLCAMVLLTVYVLFVPLTLPRDGIIFYVKPGSSRETVVRELAENGCIRWRVLFNLYSSLRGKIPKSGEYLIARGSSPYTIWKQIILGKGRYYRTFTIIPGWTYKQVQAALREDKTIRQMTRSMRDEDVMAALGSSIRFPEGMFLPESYKFSRGDSDLSILKRAYDLMQRKLNEDWSARAVNLPYQNAYQALIAASIIEKEAYLPAEQSKISGVLVNRLHKGMILQFDPTVIYGMGDRYHGFIHKSDLKTDTPYNTYIHKGLPPTPISMPGLGAIHAAVHPDINDYYYFVAKGDGSHEFTSNLKAHEAAVQRSLQKREPQGDQHVTR